jgi:hypothetical protein
MIGDDSGTLPARSIPIVGVASWNLRSTDLKRQDDLEARHYQVQAKAWVVVVGQVEGATIIPNER